MTSIHQALRQQLDSLHQLLLQLDNDAYCYTSPLLSNASIGQHSRHIIELIKCLADGYEAGIVNYDNRKRDKQIETDIHHAAAAIEVLYDRFNMPDKPMLLEGCFDNSNQEMSQVKSSYHREIVYNIEHAVHHMALIKVALNELRVDINDDTFGVAYATVQYRKLCAQ